MMEMKAVWRVSWESEFVHYLDEHFDADCTKGGSWSTSGDGQSPTDSVSHVRKNVEYN